jgi:S1-C subfamily serine protease
VIVSADGVVLTNHHVVRGAKSIRVTLADRREIPARLVGADPKSDLAVLRLKGPLKNLKAITFGDSDKMRLGSVVLAIGNPFGVGQTVTMGIVSAKGRANMGIVDYEDFIQTDAAINPGNSGGALVDMQGRLVGINTAILSRSGGYQGIGFAIPARIAKHVMGSLLRHGKVRRGFLGVRIRSVTPALSRDLGLRTQRGVLIADVEPSSAAARAGLKQRDVVLRVDGIRVDSSGRLRSIIANRPPGARVKLRILRGRKARTVSVTLGALGGGPVASRAPAGSPSRSSPGSPSRNSAGGPSGPQGAPSRGHVGCPGGCPSGPSGSPSPAPQGAPQATPQPAPQGTSQGTSKGTSKAAPSPSTPAGSGTVGGMTVAPLTQELQRRYGAPFPFSRFLVITAVAPGTKAAMAGLQAGDVILSVDRRSVSSVKRLRQRYQGLSTGGHVVLLVFRNGSTHTFALER